MKSKTAASLIQAAKDADIIFFKLVTDSMTSPAFSHITRTDAVLDIIIHSDWANRMTTGNFLKVPTVVGTVQHEGDALIVGGELAARGNAPPFITTARADILSQLGGTCGASGASADRFNNGATTWRYQYQGELSLNHNPVSIQPLTLICSFL
jgi:hypothetical protein